MPISVVCSTYIGISHRIQKKVLKRAKHAHAHTRTHTHAQVGWLPWSTGMPFLLMCSENED